MQRAAQKECRTLSNKPDTRATRAPQRSQRGGYGGLITVEYDLVRDCASGAVAVNVAVQVDGLRPGDVNAPSARDRERAFGAK